MRKPLYVLTLISSSAAFAVTPSNPSTGTLYDGTCMKYSVNAAFTYWYAKEDGLNIAESALLAPSGSTSFSSDGQVFKQSSGYDPGFKVGLGMESSSRWGLHAEYTYFRGTHSKSEAAPSTDIDPYIGVWKVNNWFLQSTLLRGEPLTGTYLTSRWKLAMDLGDLVLNRPFIQKKDFSLSPFGGLRTVWLRQNMSIYLTQAPTSIGGSNFLSPQPLHSSNNSNAFGIGPRLGAEGNYFLPYGLRLEGLFAASLLYTKFNTVKHQEAPQSTLVSQTNIETNLNNYNCVRPVIDANLGIGWGTNFSGKFNFDLSASYDFSYFWGQNMMRSMLDEFATGSSSGDNDLYFEGLTITANFSF